MSFTSESMQHLLRLSCNSYLTNSAEKKYNDFAKKDPFPEIHDALLNSVDISKYAMTTGMLEPFVPEKMLGITYTCCFSGRYLRYNKDNQVETKIIAHDEELEIQSNSITYLEIDTYFRVPHYMALRFNLKVHNAYKGLLLGTGPIIDPGYKGKIFIPLHNLTNNTYLIKRGADLISVEFTKIDRDNLWQLSLDSELSLMVNQLDFTSLSQYKPEIPENRPIEHYICQALQGSEGFYKKDKEKIIVLSSMAGLEKKVDVSIKTAAEKMRMVDKKIENYQKRERVLTVLSIISIIALLLTAVGIFITAGWYFKSAQALNEAITINPFCNIIICSLKQLLQ